MSSVTQRREVPARVVPARIDFVWKLASAGWASIGGSVMVPLVAACDFAREPLAVRAGEEVDRVVETRRRRIAGPEPEALPVFVEAALAVPWVRAVGTVPTASVLEEAWRSLAIAACMIPMVAGEIWVPRGGPRRIHCWSAVSSGEVEQGSLRAATQCSHSVAEAGARPGQREWALEADEGAVAVALPHPWASRMEIHSHPWTGRKSSGRIAQGVSVAIESVHRRRTGRSMACLPLCRTSDP